MAQIASGIYTMADQLFVRALQEAVILSNIGTPLEQAVCVVTLASCPDNEINDAAALLANTRDRAGVAKAILKLTQMRHIERAVHALEETQATGAIKQFIDNHRALLQELGVPDLNATK